MVRTSSLASPTGLRMTKPALRSSSWRRSRTRNVTSAPASTSRPPKYPPIPPAPRIRMRMRPSLERLRACKREYGAGPALRQSLQSVALSGQIAKAAGEKIEHGADQRRALQVAVDHQPDLARDAGVTRFDDLQPGLAIAEVSGQGGDAESGFRGLALHLEIAGAQHDGALAGEALQPLLLRCRLHGLVIGDETIVGGSMRAEEGGRRIERKRKTSDPARHQVRLRRPAEAHRDIRFPARQRGAALLADQAHTDAGMRRT